MFAFLLKGVLGSYPKAELSLHFNQICDRIDSWASEKKKGKMKRISLKAIFVHAL